MDSLTNDDEIEEPVQAADFGTLVAALHSMILLPPGNRSAQASRAQQIHLLLEGITAFGVDASSLVRLGMANQAWRPVMVLLIATPSASRRGEDAPLDFDGWFSALGIEAPEVNLASTDDANFQAFAKVAANVARRLALWVQLAPFQEVIALVPPDSEIFTEIPPRKPESVQAYEWLVQRFAVEEMDQWSFQSLRSEFLWREGTWVPPFPDDILATDRDTDRALYYALAKRSVVPPDVVDSRQEERLLEDMKIQAIDFLRLGRFAEAAALFEFYAHQDPESIEVLNNLGFCLIPSNPELALYHLNSIGDRPFPARTMLVYNRCLALKLLGRGEEALDIAENHWQRGGDTFPGGAYLWREVDGVVDLYNEQNVRYAFAQLVAQIALQAGRPDRSSRWNERAQSL